MFKIQIMNLNNFFFEIYILIKFIIQNTTNQQISIKASNNNETLSNNKNTEIDRLLNSNSNNIKEKNNMLNSSSEMNSKSNINFNKSITRKSNLHEVKTSF